MALKPGRARTGSAQGRRRHRGTTTIVAVSTSAARHNDTADRPVTAATNGTAVQVTSAAAKAVRRAGLRSDRGTAVWLDRK